MVGMVVAEVDALASLLGQKADQLDSVISEVKAKLDGTNWKGQDADTFRSDWDGTLTTQLRNVANQLRDAQTKATSNARAQETTSNS
jgi:uncharacterized protein YukE